ncbi:MAG: polysaccharide deacetylase [Oscillospiraceae bacterium]|nr:polysaccharide deacetylase [Oscillospiraceae bacterium]
MSKKLYTLFFYFGLALFCIHSCTGFYTLEDCPNEYEKAIAQLQYQIGYTGLYHSRSADNLKEMSAVNNDGDIHTVYLTFDDGPSQRTVEILDLLQEHNIKATFFIVSGNCTADRDIIKRIYDEGHTIGVHSASHSYKEIYSSVDAFLKDFEICYDYIENITGEAPVIFRFPGGSINNYNKKICKELINEMGRRGFTYFDWNVSSDDATKHSDEGSIYSKVMKGCKGRTSAVVLMHDSAPKKDTVAALKRIIPELLEQGFVFDRLSENVQPTVFKIE